MWRGCIGCGVVGLFKMIIEWFCRWCVSEMGEMDGLEGGGKRVMMLVLNNGRS